MKLYTKMNVLLLSSMLLTSANISLADTKSSQLVDTSKQQNNSTSTQNTFDTTKENKCTNSSNLPESTINLEEMITPEHTSNHTIEDKNKEKVELSQNSILEKMPTGKRIKQTQDAVSDEWNMELKGWGLHHKFFVLKSLKNPEAKDVTIPSYTYDSHGNITPCYLERNVFRGNNNIQSIRFSNFFEEQKGSQLYDLEKDEISQDAKGLFADMSNLKSIDFAGVDLRHILDFSQLFANDHSLTQIKNLYYLDTSQGINFDDMFNSCTNLKEIQLYNQETHQRLDFSNGRYFIGMFENCKSLEKISFWGMNFTHAQSFKEAFKDCNRLYQVEISGLSDGVDLQEMFYNSPILYAELSFEKGANQASSTKGMFHLPDGALLPLLIRSNSKTFTNKDIVSHDGRYTYFDFAQDGRILPSIICSGEGGLFKGIMGDELKGHVVRFDIHDKNGYIPKNHWENAKFSLLDTTNGYTVDSTQSAHNPIDELKNLSLIVKYWESMLPVIPTFSINKDPYYEKDISRFVLPDYKDETKKRWNLRGKYDLSNIPEYFKGLFVKYTAQYAPFNPEMAPGHTIDSKYPNSKVWPKNRTPESPLSFCYQPSSLAPKNEIILEEKAKEVALLSEDQQNRFHIGIRDYAPTKSPWVVNATLHWKDEAINDVIIKGTGGIIRKNMNNVNNKTNAPKPFKMPQLNNYDKTNVQSLIKNGFSLQNNSSVQLMKSDGKQDNNFYDLDLGNLKLYVPKENKILEGSYQGQIDWNLTVAPNGN